jgi:K+-transporting ATPase KdpF subunit
VTVTPEHVVGLLLSLALLAYLAYALLKPERF